MEKIKCDLCRNKARQEAEYKELNEDGNVYFSYRCKNHLITENDLENADCKFVMIYPLK